MAENNQINKFSRGDVLQLQGEGPSSFMLLISGKVGIYSTSSEYQGLDKSIILEHSIKVGIFSGKCYIVGVDGYTLKAEVDCQVQKFPITYGSVKYLCSQKPLQAINVIIQTFKRMEISFADINNYLKLYQNISILFDNLAILSQELYSQDVPEKLYERVIDIYEAYKTNEGAVPSAIDGRFLIQDNSRHLEKTYDLPGIQLDNIFNRNEYLFLKRFLSVEKNIFGNLLKSDPVIGDHFDRTLKGNIKSIFIKIGECQEVINEEMMLLFNEANSWIEYLVKNDIYFDWSKTGKLSPDFLKHMISIVERIYLMYSDLFGIDCNKKFPGLEMLKTYFAQKNKMASNTPSVKTSKTTDAKVQSSISKMYDKSLNQIFEFTLADKEMQQKLFAKLNEFKEMKNPFSTETEGRKIRRQITSIYWELYSQAYIRSKSVSSVPPAVKLMLRFGLLDEALLEEGQIDSYHRLYNEHFVAEEIPVLFENEFLDKIYKGSEEPSLSEMGLTYEKFIAEKNRTRIKKADIEDDLKDPGKKTIYEIENRLATTAGICSGSHASAFPILNCHQIKGDPAKFYVSKKKLTKIVQNLCNIDYSAFYRETVLKLENAREIIEEEVIPYFILLPSIGVKTMMWQDLVGVNKRSRGRIVVPTFYVGDLKKSIAHSIAIFRWELNRTMKSSMWADPVEGGMTGIYFDYISFFKKNTKLSIEAKEKVAERFKSFRNNPREIFADDYIMWVLYEKDGIMKMNNVVRDIFYRYIPFPEKLRSKLEKMPAFSDSANRFKNIRMRTLTSIDRKYKKYRDSNDTLIEPLQKYLDYLKM